MVKKQLIKAALCFATALAYHSAACAQLALNPTNIGVGIQQRQFTQNALNAYLNNDYTHDETEHMMGMYAGFNINVQQRFVIEADADFVTKATKGIGTWKLGAGIIPFSNGTISIPITAGVINYDASTNKDDAIYGKSESAGYIRTGISAMVAPRWMMDLTVQYEALDSSKTSISIENTFDAGFSLFGVPMFGDLHPTVGLSWADRNAREINIRVGAKYTFN
jgi:hypothetical protein